MLLNKIATVEFDPSNKEHRAAVHSFMKRQAWVDSPIRFSYDPKYGSIAAQVRAKLFDWYVSQDMAKISKQKV